MNLWLAIHIWMSAVAYLSLFHNNCLSGLWNLVMRIMEFLLIRFRWLVLGIGLMAFYLASSEECNSNDKVTFKRILHSTNRSPLVYPPIEKPDVLEGLGNCTSPEEFARGMMEYFAGFGVDLSIIQDPYVKYDGVNFELDMIAGRNYNVLYSAFDNGFGKFVNRRNYWGGWRLTAKQRFTGPSGTLERNHRMIYGVERLYLGGKEECVYYFHRKPVDLGSAPPDQFLYVLGSLHAEWGDGAFTGLYQITDDTVEGGGMYTFPANSD